MATIYHGVSKRADSGESEHETYREVLQQLEFLPGGDKRIGQQLEAQHEDQGAYHHDWNVANDDGPDSHDDGRQRGQHQPREPAVAAGSDEEHRVCVYQVVLYAAHGPREQVGVAVQLELMVQVGVVLAQALSQCRYVDGYVQQAEKGEGKHGANRLAHGIPTHEVEFCPGR